MVIHVHVLAISHTIYYHHHGNLCKANDGDFQYFSPKDKVQQDEKHYIDAQHAFTLASHSFNQLMILWHLSTQPTTPSNLHLDQISNNCTCSKLHTSI
jgi:hypothetical protein